MNALQRFLNAWGDYWPDDTRTVQLRAEKHLADQYAKHGWAEAHRATVERDMALRALSELKRPVVGATPATPPTLLSDTLANSHLRERNELLEAEVEHYRTAALGFAHRLSQVGEPTTLVEYGETVR